MSNKNIRVRLIGCLVCECASLRSLASDVRLLDARCELSCDGPFAVPFVSRVLDAALTRGRAAIIFFELYFAGKFSNINMYLGNKGLPNREGTGSCLDLSMFLAEVSEAFVVELGVAFVPAGPAL